MKKLRGHIVLVYPGGQKMKVELFKSIRGIRINGVRHRDVKLKIKGRASPPILIEFIRWLSFFY